MKRISFASPVLQDFRIEPRSSTTHYRVVRVAISLENVLRALPAQQLTALVVRNLHLHGLDPLESWLHHFTTLQQLVLQHKVKCGGGL